MKLYLASPVHFAAGAGNPAGSRGAKSNDAAVMDGVSYFLLVVFYPPPWGLSPLSVEGRQYGPERVARYLHQPGIRLAQIRDQEQRARHRQSEDQQRRNGNRPRLDEQAEAGEDHGQPEDQYQQKRRQYRIFAIGEHHQARVGDGGAGFQDTGLYRALRIGGRR